MDWTREERMFGRTNGLATSDPEIQSCVGLGFPTALAAFRAERQQRADAIRQAGQEADARRQARQEIQNIKSAETPADWPTEVNLTLEGTMTVDTHGMRTHTIDWSPFNITITTNEPTIRNKMKIAVTPQTGSAALPVFGTYTIQHDPVSVDQYLGCIRAACNADVWSPSMWPEGKQSLSFLEAHGAEAAANALEHCFLFRGF